MSSPRNTAETLTAAESAAFDLAFYLYPLPVVRRIEGAIATAHAARATGDTRREGAAFAELPFVVEAALATC